ncbi:MAG: glycosyltransferase [Ignavibacteriota bacterium]
MTPILPTAPRSEARPRAAVIVAHPDDETLWCGGYILTHPEFRWRIVTLCRAADADRAPKFHQVLASYGAEGEMAELDDGPDQTPIPPGRVEETVAHLLTANSYDLILTHGPRGEYTQHRRHSECCRAVVELWRAGRIDTSRLWMFAYEDGDRAYLPRVRVDADRRDVLPNDIWRAKQRLITAIYGSRQLGSGDHSATRRLLVLRFATIRGGGAHGETIMKVLVLTEYPPSAAGLATQGQLLCKGLSEIGVDVHPVHFESPQEKEWYYRWFRPDVVIGIGFWGHVPHLVLHPQQFGMKCVPWLLADGYVAAHRDLLNSLPLILVTSNWVKEVYIRDGIRGDNIVVLPVGCDTDRFVPRAADDPKVRSIREALGVTDEQILILTAGGDAASKGGQEVMQALALIDGEAPDWRYVCKVWPQPRTVQQNAIDLQLAAELGIDKKVIYSTNVVSHNFMPYLLAACDIYAAPSRLEGFGMIQVEANACAKPVVAIDAMAFLDTMVHGETAFLAKVAEERKITEAVFGAGHGVDDTHRIVFPSPRTAEFRASVPDIAKYLLSLMRDGNLRRRMGEAGRKRVVELFDYRQVARQFVKIMSERLGIDS